MTTDQKQVENFKIPEATARFLSHPNTLPPFQPGVDDEHRADYEEFNSRTSNSCWPEFVKDAIRRVPIGAFGTGTVGSNILNALVRQGAENVLASEPDSEQVELGNVSRHVCGRSHIGRQKSEALGERLTDINPYAKISVDKRGITKNSVKDLVDQVAIVVDGVEFYRFAEIAMLHEEAARQGKKVFVGLDLGFTDICIFYDYSKDPRPFYGKLDELIPIAKKAQELADAGFMPKELYDGYVLYVASKMIPHETIPLEMLWDIKKRLKVTPQLATTGSNLGNTIAVAIGATLAGLEVNHVTFANTLQRLVKHDPEEREKMRQKELAEVLASLEDVNKMVTQIVNQAEEK